MYLGRIWIDEGVEGDCKLILIGNWWCLKSRKQQISIKMNNKEGDFKYDSYNEVLHHFVITLYTTTLMIILKIILCTTNPAFLYDNSQQILLSLYIITN